MKAKYFLTIVLTLLFLYGIIHLQAEEKDYNYLSWREWELFTVREKLLYVTGYLHGSFVTSEKIVLNLDNEEAIAYIRSQVSPYYNHDIVVAIDWLYSEPYFQQLPVFNLISNLDYYLRLRYKMAPDYKGEY